MAMDAMTSAMWLKSTRKALTDYPFLCADFTGDRKITVGDAAKAYALLQGK